MGFTHYWTQTKSFTTNEWAEVSADIRTILAYVENSLGVRLANGLGEEGTIPQFEDDKIFFNGWGDDAHETMAILRLVPKATAQDRNPAWSFCKTARKPYDVAVTAVLCYLSTVCESHSVTSDGNGTDFITGLEAARAALPGKANILDIPMQIMRDDRWTGPWVHIHTKKYEFHFCVDGHAYIIRQDDGRSYRFDNHTEAAMFAIRNKDLLNASGYFDAKRIKSLTIRQNNLFKRMMSSLDIFYPEREVKPIAFVRPDALPKSERFNYYPEDVLKAG